LNCNDNVGSGGFIPAKKVPDCQQQDDYSGYSNDD